MKWRWSIGAHQARARRFPSPESTSESGLRRVRLFWIPELREGASSGLTAHEKTARMTQAALVCREAVHTNKLCARTQMSIIGTYQLRPQAAFGRPGLARPMLLVISAQNDVQGIAASRCAQKSAHVGIP